MFVESFGPTPAPVASGERLIGISMPKYIVTKAPADGPVSAPRVKLGLRGMRLRLEAVGGGMVVEMRDDRTIVRAVVPSAVVLDASSGN